MPGLLVASGTRIVSAQSFNGSTSSVEFGGTGVAASGQVSAPVTILTLCRPTTIDATARYVIGNTDSSAIGGVRLTVSIFNANSIWSGINAASGRSSGEGTASGNIAVANEWQTVAFSQDGTESSSTTTCNAKLYFSLGASLLQDITIIANNSYAWGVPSGGAGKPTVIGNRAGGSRTFAGNIAYVARWNRVLSLGELNRAQKFGPLAVRNGLIFCWANGRDYGPYHMRPSSTLAVTRVKAPF